MQIWKCENYPFQGNLTIREQRPVNKCFELPFWGTDSELSLQLTGPTVDHTSLTVPLILAFCPISLFPAPPSSQSLRLLPIAYVHISSCLRVCFSGETASSNYPCIYHLLLQLQIKMMQNKGPNVPYVILMAQEFTFLKIIAFSLFDFSFFQRLNKTYATMYDLLSNIT